MGYPTLSYGVKVEGRSEVCLCVCGGGGGGRSELWVGYPTAPYPMEFKWAIKLIKK